MRYGNFASALALLATSAQPLAAAELATEQQSRLGAFGGVLMQVPFGARGAEAAPRVGLAFGPMRQSQSIGGATRTRFGDGLELGFGGGERGARLTLAGTRIDRLGLAPNGHAPEGGHRAGVSTLGWVAIGVGAAVVIGLGGTYLWLEDALDCDPGDECN